MKKVMIMFFAVTFFFLINTQSVSASDDIIKTVTKDKVIFINGANGKFNYSWTFDKDDYDKNGFDFDMGIKFKTDRRHDINNLVGNVKKKYVSFNYHGGLPAMATVKVPVNDKFKDGDDLRLYYYDEDNNKTELVASKIEVINGYATFKINHCSDYVLTLSIVNEASGNGNPGVVIIGMIIIIVGLVGYTVFRNRK